MSLHSPTPWAAPADPDDSPSFKDAFLALTDQVVEFMTAQILSGRLAPGAELRQTQVAEELSISRTPLREALRVLSTDGLVIQQQNGTFTVVSPSLDDARDMYELRMVVDPFAAYMAATRATPSQVGRLDDLVASIQAACEPFDGPSYLAAIADFHVGVLEASGNRAILSLRSTIRMSVRVLYPRLRHGEERLSTAAGEYRRIFQAIRGGEPETARRLAGEHVQAVIDYWLAPAPATP